MTTNIVAPIVPKLEDDEVAWLQYTSELMEAADREEAVQHSGKVHASLRNEVHAHMHANAYALGILTHTDDGPVVDPQSEAFRKAEDGLMFAARSKIESKIASEAVENMVAAASFEVPEFRYASLSEALGADIPAIEYRVEGLVIEGGNVLLSAQYKVGKTTIVMGYIKSLVDGCDFMGQPVKRVTGNVVYWDAELEERYCIEQLKKLNIENTDRVIPRSIKGYSIPFQTDEAKEWTIKHLKGNNAEVWIIDTFGKLFDGDEDRNNEVRAWLHAIDEIKRRAGVREVVVVTHTGHAREGQKTRARGASYFGGWPDSLWGFERVSTTEGDTRRALKVEGRGDLLSEVWADYDPETNAYSPIERTDKDASKANAAHAFETQVWEWLRSNPESNKTAIANGIGLGTGGRNKVAGVLKVWEDSESVEFFVGEKGAKYYSVARAYAST